MQDTILDCMKDSNNSRILRLGKTGDKGLQTHPAQRIKFENCGRKGLSVGDTRSYFASLEEQRNQTSVGLQGR